MNYFTVLVIIISSLLNKVKGCKNSSDVPHVHLSELLHTKCGNISSCFSEINLIINEYRGEIELIAPKQKIIFKQNIHEEEKHNEMVIYTPFSLMSSLHLVLFEQDSK